MDADLEKELNGMNRADLLRIAIKKDLGNVEMSEGLREYFRKLLSCNECKRLTRRLGTIKDGSDRCKSLVDLSGTDTEGNDEEIGKNWKNTKKMSAKTTPTEVFNVPHAETELKQFYDYCKENNLSDDEIASVCKPLLSSMRDIRAKFLIYLSIFGTIIAILYFLSYSDAVQWHYSALARMFMIELLPVWDWKDLKGEKCIVRSLAGQNTPPPETQDCVFCEYVHTIDVIDASEKDFIYRKYIKLHKPVLLENGLAHWTKSHRNFDEFLSTLLEDRVLANSYPCKFKSNTYYGSGNLYQSLKNIRDYPSYFAQFQNCEFEAVKAFRKYFPRPKFLAAEIQPVQYSWLLFSKNYEVDRYKPVLLTDQVTIVGQVVGTTEILLQAADCAEDCKSLKIELAKGEVLIFGGPWNMDYKPHDLEQNLAIVLETR